MSRFEWTTAVQRCLALGMDDYLSKPLRMIELSPMLNKWLPVAQPRPVSDNESTS